jgi:hypothetical protein
MRPRPRLLALGLLLVVAVGGALIGGHAAGAQRAAKRSSIGLVSAPVADARVVAHVVIRAQPAAVRWKLRVDGKSTTASPVKVKVITSGFLVPGDHKVQALLLDRRGAPLATSAIRVVHVDALIAAAGDIACDPADPGYAGTGPECHQRQTAKLLALRHYAGVLTLGDEQYECGTTNAFQQSYATTWGKYKAITHPAVGDHEYGTTKLTCPKATAARDYFAYFGPAAGDPTKGYYSFDLGGWHMIALNGNCDEVGGCGAGSPQEQWLAADLAAHPALCTLAYWHEPLFSSALAGDTGQVVDLWRDLYAAHTELVLNGHAHVYERMAPQTPDGIAAADGIRQFVVGVGGRSFSQFVAPVKPLSVARQADTYGLLALTLGKKSYTWQFVPEAGKSYSDTGSAACQ